MGKIYIGTSNVNRTLGKLLSGTNKTVQKVYLGQDQIWPPTLSSSFVSNRSNVSRFVAIEVSQSGTVLNNNFITTSGCSLQESLKEFTITATSISVTITISSASTSTTGYLEWYFYEGQGDNSILVSSGTHNYSGSAAWQNIILLNTDPSKIYSFFATYVEDSCNAPV